MSIHVHRGHVRGALTCLIEIIFEITWGGSIRTTRTLVHFRRVGQDWMEVELESIS
ncbi:hypothetical protein ASPCADRAFT_210846 [Aspergillus carbonarius ITEM 5010]|uniref:Uncharacterized protein n=1 Tax=Aspergillus carbonarius (strain ITEM 5010) TaxID=602072 RepID=A0A1R3RBW8_ASPC5|nr:hypothetical protein ASPCADRAFT_210846 [Aspergillus carbonarius ITEM 5010]